MNAPEDVERGAGSSSEPVRTEPPSALESIDRIAADLDGRRPALFFDYDGTLTPIARRPEEATLSGEMRALLRDLAKHATVAIVSGRDLSDVRGMVGLGHLYYAGSHGFDIAGPHGVRMQIEGASDYLPELEAAEHELARRLRGIGGAWVERKRFALAVHYRESDERDVGRIERAVDDVRDARPRLRKKEGKKIFELQPDIPWDKGRAVLWLLDRLGLSGPGVLPVYVGDDVTDEDAFLALSGRGLAIRVGSPGERTHAHLHLRDVKELERFGRSLLGRVARPRNEDG